MGGKIISFDRGPACLHPQAICFYWPGKLLSCSGLSFLPTTGYSLLPNILIYCPQSQISCNAQRCICWTVLSFLVAGWLVNWLAWGELISLGAGAGWMVSWDKNRARACSSLLDLWMDGCLGREGREPGAISPPSARSHSIRPAQQKEAN